MADVSGNISTTQNITGSVSNAKNISGSAGINVGATPNIQIGTTTTLEVGQEATVELDVTSTKLNPIINFGIPRGGQGIQGEKGEPGQAGLNGKDGAIQYIAGTNIEITDDNVINAVGGLAEETDPTVPNYVKAITQEDIDKWNNGGSSSSIGIIDATGDTQININDYTTVGTYLIVGTNYKPSTGYSGLLTVTSDRQILQGFSYASNAYEHGKVYSKTLTATSWMRTENIPLRLTQNLISYTTSNPSNDKYFNALSEAHFVAFLKSYIDDGSSRKALSKLTTTDKTSLVAAINELKTSIDTINETLSTLTNSET